MVSVQKASSACGTFESRLTLSGTHIEEGGGGVVEGGVIVLVTCNCHLTALRVISVTRQVAGDRGVSNVLLPREWKGAPGLCRHGELVVCVCVCVCVRARARLCLCAGPPPHCSAVIGCHHRSVPDLVFCLQRVYDYIRNVLADEIHIQYCASHLIMQYCAIRGLVSNTSTHLGAHLLTSAQKCHVYTYVCVFLSSNPSSGRWLS